MKRSVGDTILFDLDGTLLLCDQKAFVDAYFAELGKMFVRLGMDAGKAVKAVWTGTKAMLLNDGSRTNAERFWEVFSEVLELSEEKRKTVETECDLFYQNEFDTVRSIVTPQDISKRLIRSMTAKGYTVVLATNPLFPMYGVETRLKWIGLETRDFAHVTHYTNSTYCKPSAGYYREIFAKIGKEPEQCLMVGNNPAEDMCAGALGADTYLVTDCLENENGADISAFRHGTLAELEVYLATEGYTKNERGNVLIDLDRLLNSIGKATFVKYYYNFKNCSRDYCIGKFEESFTDKAKSSKTGHAQTIFRRNLEKDALIKISKSNRVDANAILNAQKILEMDFSYKEE
jgi:FMN phosphatase YigB (HAD superfamily)